MRDDFVHAVTLFTDFEAANFHQLPDKIQAEFQAYLSNPQHKWQLKLKPQGTDFQRKVWSRLQKIPVGSTISYGELAAELKSHPRAIGQACRNNPIPIIIPCHRVVAKNSIGGFSGSSKGNKIALKEFLLHHESHKHK